MQSKRLELIINSAVVKANQLHHEYLTLELLFLSMLSDDEVRSILKACGADVAKMESDLIAFINDQSNFSVLSQEDIETLSEKHFSDLELRNLAKENGIYYQPEISMGLQRVIQRAAIHVQSSGKKDILGINLLVALFNEQESFVNYLLELHGVQKFEVVKLIAHGVDKPINAEGSINDDIRAELGGEKSEKTRSALKSSP